MNILGISAFYHDSAACLIQDGASSPRRPKSASRARSRSRLPDASRRATASKPAASPAPILDYVGFYDKPLIKFERILYTYMATFPKSFPSFMKALPLWLTEKLWIPAADPQEARLQGPDLFAEHHESHAASSFLVSPYEEAAILTVDGVGEWATSTMGVGTRQQDRDPARDPLSRIRSDSVQRLHLLPRFKVNSAEYKVMGWRRTVEPRYMKEMEELISIAADGSFKMNMSTSRTTTA
jgi:carbamoyltransferase